MTEPAATPAEPLLQVLRGRPTAEELAAVITVLAAVRRTPAPPAEPVSSWAAYWRELRAPLVPGPGAWQASARPTAP